MNESFESDNDVKSPLIQEFCSIEDSPFYIHKVNNFC